MDEFNKNYEYWEAVGKRFGAKTVWSIYEAPRDADLVAIEGQNLTLEYRTHWGNCGTVRTKLPDNPTYRDLFVAADKLIRESTDNHHIFIERFDRDPKKPNTFVLTTGS